MKRLFSLVLVTTFFLIAACSVENNTPTTLAELNRWYVEPPAAENAATKFLQALAAVDITDSDKASPDLPLIDQQRFPGASEPIPEAMKSALAEFIERNTPALTLLVEATNRTASRYPIDLNSGMKTPLPHVSKFRPAARMLAASAVSAALEGRGEGAGESILLGLALGRSLEHEPVLISQLVRIATDAITVSGVEQVINRASLPVTTLHRLQEALHLCEARAAMGYGFSRGLVGERISALSSFEMPPEQYLLPPADATPEERKRLMPKIAAALKADRDFCARTFDQIERTRKLPFPERLAQDAVFSQAVAIATNRNLRLSSLLFDAGHKIASREARSVANLRLAQTAVALERFRATHTNSYPDSLSELLPQYMSEIPVDPFDGQHLRYRRLEQGYVLFSLGQNLRDEGGKRGKGEEGDLVFSVIIPPKPAR